MPTNAEEARRPLEFDAEGRLALDLPCRACGHNLRGQAPDARCPECSVPVSLSARSDLLRCSDPAWIERLARGMQLVLVGLLFLVVVAPVLTAGGTGPQGGMVIFGVGGCTVAVASLVFGIWGLVLLFRYAAHFRAAAEEAREVWGGPW